MSESTVKPVFGWLLIMVGGLWVLLTGGCTLAFIQTGLLNGSSSAMAGVWVFLVIGLFCVAPGAAVLWLGVAMVRRKPDTDAAP